MTTRISITALSLGALLSFFTSARAENPFITSIFTADPSAHIWSDGRLYVYPSHDIDPPRGCDLMDRYHVFSTDDMTHWRDEGEILRASDVSWGRSEGGFMWAPDCAFKEGMYYFYFPHPSGTDWNQTLKIGVAKSTKPASDFKPAGFIEGLDGRSMIDPSVFIDDDGQAYFYYGGGGRCQGGKLQENMVQIEGKMREMTGLIDFHEATWVFKRNGIYYLTYSDNQPAANRLRYAISSSPLGPWTHKGIYLQPTGCDTSHGSVVEYKGKWYAFYHNQSLSGQGNLRSICVDELKFNHDGAIQPVIQTKATAPANEAPEKTKGTITYEAETGTVGNSASSENDDSASGGKSVQNLHLAGAFVELNQVEGGKRGGQATIDVRYASAENAKIRLLVNGADYSLLNAFATGGWSKYNGHTSLTVPLGSGATNTIKLVGGNGGVNVDSISVIPLNRE